MKTVCLFLTVLLFSSGVSGEKITFEDLYGVTKISDPQISTDGKRIALVVRTTDIDSLKSVSHIWTLNSDGTGLEQITFSDNSPAQPQWLPGGNTIAYTAYDKETDANQIWTVSLKSDSVKKVSAVATGVSDYKPGYFKDDCGIFVFTSRVFLDCPDDSCNLTRLEEIENNPVRAKLYDHLLFRHYNHWYDDRVEQLFILDNKNKRHRKLFKTPFGDHNTLFHSYAPHPDGSEICFAMNTDTLPAVYINYDLFTLPISGGEPRRLTSNKGHDTHPLYSPDGRYLAYLRMARAGYESDQRELIIIDLETNEETNLTATFDRSVGEYLWSPDSKEIYFTAIEHGLSKIWRVDIASQKVELVLDNAVYSDLRISPDGEYMIFTRSLSDQPYELYRFDLKDRKITQLTHFNDDMVSRLTLNRAEDFWFAGFNGDSVHGFLTLPPDFDPGQKYPLALLIHGGPQWCWLGDFNYYGWNTQLVAAQGYIVAQIDPHGSAGYGLKFKEYVSGNWGKGDYEDLMLGVDYLISKHPYIDSTRTVALGRSYGGFMVNWICGHTDRFKCLISIDGTFNHLSDYGSTEELWFPEWECNGTPWTNREEYVRSSPMTYAENFKTPTMVIHGQLDYRVDLSEGLQMFTALQRMGVPSQLLYFPDEGHSVGKLKNLRHVYQKQFEWLERWLR
ncbi:MAG: S9 family peptidase [candidate division Zixibacteria bacterium]|nr:S9 family peptidase [candidate division Zixibacteria bacterium]